MVDNNKNYSRLNVVFYDNDREVHTELKIQAVREKLKISEMAIKAIKFYLNEVNKKEMFVVQ